MFEGAFCTSQATVTCNVNEVLAYAELTKASIDPTFMAMDFDCVTEEKLVPLAVLDQLLMNEELPRWQVKEYGNRA